MSKKSWPRDVLDKYRDINVDTNWWSDELIAEFKDDMLDIGVRVDQVYWSGFWNQGDGACFEGRIVDWGKYLTHLGYTDPILIDTAAEWWSYELRHRGRYCHENSVDHDHNVFLPDNPYTVGYYGESKAKEAHDEEQFRAAVWDATMAQHDLLELTEKIEADLKDRMTKLYRTLEQEYDYLTSDEAVAETLEANNIEPNELTEQE